MGIIEDIDHAIDDYSVSSDAMRWTPKADADVDIQTPELRFLVTADIRLLGLITEYLRRDLQRMLDTIMRGVHIEHGHIRRERFLGHALDVAAWNMQQGVRLSLQQREAL